MPYLHYRCLSTLHSYHDFFPRIPAPFPRQGHVTSGLCHHRLRNYTLRPGRVEQSGSKCVLQTLENGSWKFLASLLLVERDRPFFSVVMYSKVLYRRRRCRRRCYHFYYFCFLHL
ncbi:hypothetical protein RB213_003099 [Colletotrichum asianum]